MRLIMKFLAIGLFSLVFFGVVIEKAHADGGVTPGTYTYYIFPSGTAPLNDVTFGITVLADPGRANVFWSNQFNFTTHGAYIGMQRFREGQGLFLFSVWNAPHARPGDKGSSCLLFGGEGSGYSCRMSGPFTAGHHYQFKISPDSDGWYKATVSDMNNGQSFVLGSIELGSRAKIKTDGMVNWVEYFDWNNPAARCMDEPYSKARFDLPLGNGGLIKASSSGIKSNPPCLGQVVNGVHEDGIGNSPAGSVIGSNGKCLGVSGGGSTDDTPLHLFSCTQNNNQNWVLASDGTVRALFKCMTASGSAVQLSTCNGAKTQMWKLQNGALINQASKICLTANSETSMALAACSGNVNQRWNTPG